MTIIEIVTDEGLPGLMTYSHYSPPSWVQAEPARVLDSAPARLVTHFLDLISDPLSCRDPPGVSHTVSARETKKSCP